MNEKPVFNMTHAECCREIKTSGQSLRIEVERFDEKTELETVTRARVDIFIGEITLFPVSKNSFLD